MKQDTIFYQLFKRSPTLLFELISNFPPQATGYRFDSVEVKETAFRADGVFLPPTPDGNVFFGEVQQALDNLLYERLLAEIAIFAYRDRDSFKDWRAVVIYPTRDIEQKRLDLVQEFIASGRITRIYLDELGEIEDLPWGLALMVLTILPSEEMLAKAKIMLQQFSVEEATSPETSNEGSAILDLVITAIVYKFSELSRDEVLVMLGLELKEPRAFQETRAEGEALGEAKGETKGKLAAVKEGIEAILLVRFGEIDDDLATVVPELMKLDSREYTRLLLNLSRSELIAFSLVEQSEE
jgi:predicted transposase/invertase (TIGR01784 family)